MSRRNYTRMPVMPGGFESEFKLSERTELSGLMVKYRHPRAGIVGHRIIPNHETDSVFLPAGTWRVTIEPVPHRVLWWRHALAVLDRFIAWMMEEPKRRGG